MCGITRCDIAGVLRSENLCCICLVCQFCLKFGVFADLVCLGHVDMLICLEWNSLLVVSRWDSDWQGWDVSYEGSCVVVGDEAAYFGSYVGFRMFVVVLLTY